MTFTLLADDASLAALEVAYLNARAEFEAADESYREVSAMRAKCWRALSQATITRSNAVNRRQRELIENRSAAPSQTPKGEGAA